MQEFELTEGERSAEPGKINLTSSLSIMTPARPRPPRPRYVAAPPPAPPFTPSPPSQARGSGGDGENGVCLSMRVMASAVGDFGAKDRLGFVFSSFLLISSFAVRFVLSFIHVHLCAISGRGLGID